MAGSGTGPTMWMPCGKVGSCIIRTSAMEMDKDMVPILALAPILKYIRCGGNQ